MNEEHGRQRSDLSDGLGPAAWAVMAFGRVQKLVVRADVADELACEWRESDPEATAIPLYTWAAVEAEREGIAQWLDGQGQPGYAHDVRFRA